MREATFAGAFAGYTESELSEVRTVILSSPPPSPGLIRWKHATILSSPPTQTQVRTDELIRWKQTRSQTRINLIGDDVEGGYGAPECVIQLSSAGAGTRVLLGYTYRRIHARGAL
jgi:hypothetical protein